MLNYEINKTDRNSSPLKLLNNNNMYLFMYVLMFYQLFAVLNMIY